MRIFVSYARAQEALAEELAMQLRQEGHEVFFDRFDLKAGEGFHESIRRSIRRSQLFVFLISPDAVAPQAYALTELKLAQEKWPNAVARLLPVMAVETPFDRIPAYVRSVNVLKPAGNVVAHTLAEVARLAAAQRRRRLLGAGVAALLPAGALAWWWRERPGPVAAPCLADVRFQAAPGRTEPAVSAVEVEQPGQAPRSFLVVGDGRARIDVAFSGSPSAPWSVEPILSDGSRKGKVALRGCPAQAQEHKVDASLVMVVEPRSN
jgi:hypothetical protein